MSNKAKTFRVALTILFMIVLFVAGAWFGSWVIKPAGAASGDPGGPPAGGTVYGEGYLYDRQIAVFRGAMAGPDAGNWAAILATPAFYLNGRTNLAVSGRFSNAAATCGVRIAWVWVSGANSYLLGLSDEQTLTASGITDVGGLFVAPDRFFDGAGAIQARVLVTTACSAGTVALWVGSY